MEQQSKKSGGWVGGLSESRFKDCIPQSKTANNKKIKAQKNVNYLSLNEGKFYFSENYHPNSIKQTVLSLGFLRNIQQSILCNQSWPP